jgi:hypothetical protein
VVALLVEAAAVQGVDISGLFVHGAAVQGIGVADQQA